MEEPNTDQQMEQSLERAADQGGPAGDPLAADPLAEAAPGGQAQQQARRLVDDAFDYDVGARMAFVGAGQCGGRLARAFYNLGYRRVAVVNTTDQDFEDLPQSMARHSLQTQGAAKDTEAAREAVRGREAEVSELIQRSLGDDLEQVFVCAGVGGGSGGGLAGPLVDVIRQQHPQARTGALVALPDTTEGPQVCANAVRSLLELYEKGVSPLLIVDNKRVRDLYRPPISQFHEVCNKVTAYLLHAFNYLSAVHSPYITFDRAELHQLLGSGVLTLSRAPVSDLSTASKISEAIRSQMDQSTLAEVDMTTASLAALLFVAPRTILDRLDMEYFDAGYEALQTIIRGQQGGQVDVHRGLYESQTVDELHAYTMVGGLDLPRQKLEQLAEVGRSSAQDRSRLAQHLGVA